MTIKTIPTCDERASKTRVLNMLELLEGASKVADEHYRSCEKNAIHLDIEVAGRVSELLQEAVGLYEGAYQKLDPEYQNWKRYRAEKAERS